MAQIQLKCPNCRQDFEDEIDENTFSAELVRTKCPSCGIVFQSKNNENADESGDECVKQNTVPEDFEVIFNMEMHPAFDIPGNRKYREDANVKAKSSAFGGLRLFLQCLWNGFRLALIALISFSWFGIAGLFLEEMPVYAKWISFLILPVLLLVLTVIMAIRIGKNTRSGKCCPGCGKLYSMAKIKMAPMIQSELIPCPVLAMTIDKCTACGTEVTRKEEYPTLFVILAWASSVIVMIAVYALMISAVPGVMMKLTILFIMMVTWGVYLFAPVKYSDPLRVVSPEE